MDSKKIAKLIIVYIILIPFTWLLSAMVTGGVGGYIAGQKIAKAYSDPQSINELRVFMNSRGLSASMTKEESELQFEKLSKEENEEFKKIVIKSIKVDDMYNFSSVFVISVIVFSIIGFLSGILTKTWFPVGIFPLIALSLDPLRQFIVYGYMCTGQKVITVLVGQFATCYALAYAGVLVAKRFKKRNRGTNLPVHSDAPEGGA